MPLCIVYVCGVWHDAVMCTVSRVNDTVEWSHTEKSLYFRNDFFFLLFRLLSHRLPCFNVQSCSIAKSILWDSQNGNNKQQPVIRPTWRAQNHWAERRQKRNRSERTISPHRSQQTKQKLYKIKANKKAKRSEIQSSVILLLGRNNFPILMFFIWLSRHLRHKVFYAIDFVDQHCRFAFALTQRNISQSTVWRTISKSEPN